MSKPSEYFESFARKLAHRYVREHDAMVEEIRQLRMETEKKHKQLVELHNAVQDLDADDLVRFEVLTEEEGSDMESLIDTEIRRGATKDDLKATVENTVSDWIGR